MLHVWFTFRLLYISKKIQQLGQDDIPTPMYCYFFASSDTYTCVDQWKPISYIDHRHLPHLKLIPTTVEHQVQIGLPGPWEKSCMYTVGAVSRRQLSLQFDYVSL